jgi:hypothetical protein
MVRSTQQLAAPRSARLWHSFVLGGLLLAVAFLLSLTATAKAQAADCMSARACSDAASWQNAVADDYSNKSTWFRATSRQNFINAKEWGDKATFAFYAGDGTAAAWYKAIADDYSRKSVADGKAADDYAAQAQFYRAVAQDSISRSEFFGVLGEAPAFEVVKDGRKCEHTIHHPSDPDAFGSGKPNSFGCEYWNNWIKVCDRHVDGHRVRVEWLGDLDRPGVDGPWSTDWAPSQGCLDQSIGASGIVIKFRVCVENEGCSAWRRGSSP